MLQHLFRIHLNYLKTNKITYLYFYFCILIIFSYKFDEFVGTPKSSDSILSKNRENITYSCPDVSSNVKKVLSFNNNRRRSLSPSILGVEMLKNNGKQGNF